MKNLKAFYVFDVTASVESISKAANSLHITHGAVSKQIKLLERELGTTLFIRQGRGIKLTASGVLLKDYTSAAFDELTKGVETLSGITDNTISVSCEPTLTMRWLMPRMAIFYKNHPNTDIKLSTAGGNINLRANHHNIAIRRDDFEVASQYATELLVEEWVGPVFSPDYWQQIQHNLNNVKLIHSETRPNAWQHWLTHSDNATQFKGCSHVSFAHFYFCYQAALDGLGAAIGSHPLIIDDLNNGKLVAPFGFVQSGHNYIAISLRGSAVNKLSTLR